MNEFSTLKNNIKQYLNKKINTPYTIVSLGVNCYTKTFLTKFRFKKKKNAGELTLPFDFTFYTEAKYITEFIRNDFSDYFEELYFVKENQYWGKARKIFFSHEISFKENDKDKLVSMYKERIKNYYLLINNEKPVVFFQILTDKSIGEDVENLYELLKTKINKTFVLAVVDCDNIIQKPMSQEINILKLPKPHKDYDFYSKECYRSPEGRKFEKQIEKFTENIIKTKLKQNVIKYF